jgi:preprotein translocase subunit SecG
MDVALQLVAIIISVALIVVVLLQVKGGGLGEMLGSTDTGVTRTRRGLEKTLFQVTIALAFTFLLVSILAVSVLG